MALRAHRSARDAIVSQEKHFPVRVALVEATDKESGAVFLTFKTDSPKRGNLWMVQIDGEDFTEIIAAMMNVDPLATAIAFQEASGGA